ncbi:helix-turn-helix domain-containing protein [Arsenophonus sp. PmNCSU2021_1]|uniref:helix-turn-helix domain-containing protein n=1 Tax=Arsenophonus sp. PmNCSU2021_1 TaxID=3118989 RepID=UPI002FEF552F
MTLSKRLALAMKEKGFTQSSLARKAGMAQSMIWKLISGNAHSTSKIVELAKILGVRPEWLNDGVEPMYPAHPQQHPVYYSNLTPVKIYNGSHDTEHLLMIPNLLNTTNCRAYKITSDSGCYEAPRGTFIVVDANETPGNNDLVYAKIKEDYSVYRFVDGGTDKYLAVDDSRVPLISISEVELLGVIVYLLRNLKRVQTGNKGNTEI